MLNAFKAKLASRGARGMIGLRRVFKIIDDDGSKSLNPEEFFKALNDFRLKVTQEEAQKLFRIFDKNQDYNIHYDEFLRGVAGDMNEFRVRLVERAFKKIDKDKSGVLDIDDVKGKNLQVMPKGVYDASKHPDVMSGKKDEEEILSEFLDTFEMHYSLDVRQITY
jgi:hypothetical protein